MSCLDCGAELPPRPSGKRGPKPKYCADCAAARKAVKDRDRMATGRINSTETAKHRVEGGLCAECGAYVCTITHIKPTMPRPPDTGKRRRARLLCAKCRNKRGHKQGGGPDTSAVHNRYVPDPGLQRTKSGTKSGRDRKLEQETKKWLKQFKTGRWSRR